MSALGEGGGGRSGICANGRNVLMSQRRAAGEHMAVDHRQAYVRPPRRVDQSRPGVGIGLLMGLVSINKDEVWSWR